jgi:exo-beta-1,3-glucanase (GH17 family)
MAYPHNHAESPAQQPFLEHASPVDGSDSDVPPPPPAHRVPVGLHADSQHFNNTSYRPPYQDPNLYSDLSTPGMSSDGHSGHSDYTADANINGLHSATSPHAFLDRSPNATPSNDRHMYSHRSYDPHAPLAPGAAAAAGMYSESSSLHSMPLHPPHGVPYTDSPYNRYSSSVLNDARDMGNINPNELADDDDWGMGPDHPQNKRRSFVMPFGASRDGSNTGSPGSSINSGVAGAGAGAGAGVGAAAAAGAYAANREKLAGSGGSHGGSNPELIAEKAEWLRRDHAKRKKRMWIAITIIAIILIGAIVGGVAGALVNRGGGGGGNKSPSGVSASDVAADNKDDLDKNSDEIKKLLNNKDLHKVFPGMDYTPLNSQYPECVHSPPSQNNITRDLAVMSQLTNSVRLYGTDCNQTQMLIHAKERLELTDMKFWLGVWLDKNDTTTQRQIDQTWTILDDYGCDHFKGIIIGNEVLYRKDLSVTELLGHISDFRKNITDHKCHLPVAMADLGDNWTADMATKVDIVMSNVHPFFSGTEAKDAAVWTWNFWQQNDVALTASSKDIKQVIAEVGWPTAGGRSCGMADSCDVGSVAGVDELNLFMEDWVCQSLKNETEYFW